MKEADTHVHTYGLVGAPLVGLAKAAAKRGPTGNNAQEGTDRTRNSTSNFRSQFHLQNPKQRVALDAQSNGTDDEADASPDAGAGAVPLRQRAGGT